MGRVFSPPPKQRPRYSGGTIWSVTQILDAAGVCPDFTGIPPERLAAKAAIGTECHALIESYLRADGSHFPLFEGASDRALTYFDSWMRFFEDCGTVEPLYLEGEMVTPEYAGCVDFVGRIDAINVIIDWKTSVEVYPHYKAQLTGYLHLAKKVLKLEGDWELWCVQLHETGKKRYKINKYEPDHPLWYGCLAVFDFRLRNGLWPT